MKADYLRLRAEVRRHARINGLREVDKVLMEWSRQGLARTA
ncbi:MAG TPA: hypothetical protein VL545_13520 [Rhodanobacter sp.]|nr:hypothetical protein [Rhodanobacter sp.]